MFIQLVEGETDCDGKLKFAQTFQEGPRYPDGDGGTTIKYAQVLPEDWHPSSVTEFGVGDMKSRIKTLKTYLKKLQSEYNQDKEMLAINEEYFWACDKEEEEYRARKREEAKQQNIITPKKCTDKLKVGGGNKRPRPQEKENS